MISILYVDDEPGLLQIGKLFLERIGDFRIGTETSAKKALEIIGENKFDAIISDYQMPDMDGIEFLRRVRASGNPIPFIIFTGRGREEIVIQALNEGADFYIQKGGEPGSQFAELAHKVRLAVQQRRAEMSIRNHERREADILDFLPDATFAIDRDGVVIAWNRAIEQMTGIRAVDIIGKGNYEYAIPFYHYRRPILIDLVLHEDTATSLKYPIITREGNKLISEIAIPHFNEGRGAVLWFTASPLYNTWGEVTGAIESIREITERKKVEEALNESEQNYRLLFENATEGILIAQGDRMVHVNPALVRLVGRSAQVLTSRPFTDFIHPADREKVMARHQRRMKGEIPETGYMFRILRGDGELRWVWINSTSIIWSGKPASFSFLTDVTERKLAEDGLEASTREYTNLLEQIQDVFYRTDTGGRLTRASRSWANILGYDDISECIGRNIADDFYANPMDRQSLVEEIYRQGRVTNYKVMLKRKDGTHVPVETNSHLYYDTRGEILGIEGTFRDITQQAEQEIILRIQLELGMALQKAHRMKDAMETCLDAAIRLSNMDSGAVYIVDECSGTVDLVLSRNLERSFLEHPIHLSSSSEQARIVREGKPLYFSYHEIGALRLHGPDDEGIKSVAILPITSGGRSIACLNVSSHTQVEIPERSRVALETMTTQIVSAIERIYAEEALAESERRYRNVVEDQTEMITRFLPDGTHVFVNEAYCKYFGFAREEILRHRFKPVIPSDDREMVNGFFESLTPDHPVGTIKHRIIMADGSVRWQQWSDRAIFGSDGTIIEYQSVGRDISDLKEAELSLHEMESWHHSLSEISMDLIFIIDQDDRVIFVNQAAADLLGRSPPEIIGRKRSSLFPGEISKMQQAAIQKVISTGAPFRGTGQMTVGDHLRWFDHSLIPVRDKSGAVTRVFGISRDITEQKEIEEALQRSRDQLNLAIEGSGVGLWIRDIRTGKIDINERWADILGYTLDELGPIDVKTWNGLVHPEDRAIPSALLEKYFTGEIPSYECEIRMRHKDGHWVWVLTRGKVTQWGPDGKPVRVMGTHLEITGRKNAEDALKRANRQMKLLTGITRHDILNSIMVADGYLQLLETPESESGRYSIGMIHAMLRKISRQIQFTKEYESLGSQEPLWQNIGNLLKYLEIPSSVLFTVDCSRAEVLADIMLMKVFENLLENSVRYAETSGISIRVTCQESCDGLIVTWEDNGRGISSDEKERIFDRGYGEGTGLGLFFSREILGITGITIRETGEIGQGARFEILVPDGHYRILS